MAVEIVYLTTLAKSVSFMASLIIALFRRI